MLQMYISLPSSDAKVLQKIIESLVHSMEETHHIHTQLEQRIQKLAEFLIADENIRNRLPDILNMAAIPANEIEKKTTTSIAAQLFTPHTNLRTRGKKRAAPQSRTPFTENKKQRKDNAANDVSAAKKVQR